MTATNERLHALRQAPLAGDAEFVDLDPWLTGAVCLLLLVGLVMVCSSSIAMAERHYHEPLHYFWRQLAAIGIGFAAAAVVYAIPLHYWHRHGLLLLCLGAALLILVLIPGIGREANGARRWLILAGISIQTSEIVKPCVILYIASYLVRHGEAARSRFLGSFKPIAVIGGLACLLLAEPDFGTTVVLLGTTMGVLFLAGINLRHFLFWVLSGAAGLGALVALAPYRMQRILVFLDPWQEKYKYESGFQLTQALIAFGRGEWYGTGLGQGVQKLFYLPEAHTDFLFAILAEELGFAGTLTVILLFCLLICRILAVGGRAERLGHRFGAYVAYGVACLLGIQAFVNMGVNMGVLPTKGLTLPFLSYGSNSVIVCLALMGLVLRVARESRNRDWRIAEQRQEEESGRVPDLLRDSGEPFWTEPKRAPRRGGRR